MRNASLMCVVVYLITFDNVSLAFTLDIAPQVCSRSVF